MNEEDRKACHEFVNRMIINMSGVEYYPHFDYAEMKLHLETLIDFKFRLVSPRYKKGHSGGGDILDPKYEWGNNVNFRGLRNHLKSEIGEWTLAGLKSYLDASGSHGGSSGEVAMNDEILELVDIVNMCFMVIAESLALRAYWASKPEG